MKRAYIVHRWEGTPLRDWHPWLKAELEKIGYEVCVPEMPDTENPIIADWVNKFEEVAKDADKESFFIGHSIGCQTIMRFIEKSDRKFGNLVFVAGWFYLANLENEEVEKIAKPWLETPIDLENIKSKIKSATVFLSDNDPYNCVAENFQAFRLLTNKISILNNFGHFTDEDGITEFPQLLEKIKEMEK